MVGRDDSKRVFCLLVFIATLGWAICQGAVDVVTEPYLLDTGLVSRSISFENPTGAPGEGGKAASRLGVGRKGAPMINLKAGQQVQLCDIAGPGTIRHIWMTTRRDPLNLRSLVLRAWWDGQDHPSIESPICDFMGFAHGKVMPYHSAAHSLGQNAGMNIWLPMPFTRRAKITLTNEGAKDVPLYYQIDYTIADKHPSDVGRLHALFRRENPTTVKKDLVMLPTRKNKGRFVGAVLGIRNLTPGQWWGEGEIKIFMDGDKEFPTICGTGSEDYVGLSYGMQQTPYFYNGCSLNQGSFVSMYRWHLPDPIFWQKECRITIQQIAWKNGLAETQDDWSCATFWYEPVPSAPLPQMPDVTLRTVNIWPEQTGIVKLFNGKDLSGWEASGDAKWVVENGFLVGTQGENNAPGDLFTTETYKDFVATVTYRTEWPCNSGLWFRYQSPKKAYQADVLEYKNPVAWSGTLYCPGKLFLAVNDDPKIVNRDDWNTIVVRVKGDHIQVWLNGHKTADVRDDTSDSGKIGFQVHPGEQFGPMKIVVRELTLRPL
ncbi:MAG: DUF2961 domain-containing protein [Phycisphaerales bacterium]|nr:MAG: DUF2961 domain-containing protein [Phycisphaerales bacterium]